MSTTTYPSPSLSPTDKVTCNPSTNPPQLPTSLPAGFDTKLAYLLGLCCGAASDQYTANVTNTPIIQNDPKLNDPKNWGIKSVSSPPWDPDFSRIVARGYKPNPTHQNLTVYETDENGNYVKIPAGFIVRLESTDAKNSLIVVAFHGTHNSYELNTIDNNVTPATFTEQSVNLGSVHGGFYAQYTNGTNGSAGDLQNRADGSLAKQIYDYCTKNADVTVPVKVTGHSLGGALATLCAMDIAYNFKSKFKSVSMYSLASPRVADAWAISMGTAATFVSNYQQYVPDTYRIVNTLDGVPNLPPAAALLYVCAHVLGDTDAEHLNIVNKSPLDQNVLSFTDANLQNTADSQVPSPQECQGAHSLPAVYLPFLERLANLLMTARLSPPGR
jgi:Lipase (class 3)